MTDSEPTVEIPEEAAIVASAILKSGARSLYSSSVTEKADVYHGTGRRLNDETRLKWSELDDVNIYEGVEFDE